MVLHGPEFPPGETAVLISNHPTRLDWMYLWLLMARAGRLGNFKIALKVGACGNLSLSLSLSLSPLSLSPS
jgi:hypothetical protein